MASAPQPRPTPGPNLAVARAAESGSEFLDGRMYGMGGASCRHNRIAANLSNQLRGGPGRPPADDPRAAIGDGSFAHPALVVVCGAPQSLDDESDPLANPRGILETLSPSTREWDRGGKFANYRQVASLRQHGLVRQDAPRVEQADRQADDSWAATDRDGLDATPDLDAVAAAVPPREVYFEVFGADAPP